ncbi:T-complex protein 11-domain-containing protein [Radiomyces spectabilis]|uniref:T-complex protein 11-domain-containing protein n=1 Tax=Radiomyces spectabilis TaxID=64574 RepID=UPI002220DE28|nr:T-complex protein 11-domain-containing protein [Radiomyces spectabilis]KAI8365902.1 T-complex protein 11-domain-containing protein [Radiomyces spectabilis]
MLAEVSIHTSNNGRTDILLIPWHNNHGNHIIPHSSGAWPFHNESLSSYSITRTTVVAFHASSIRAIRQRKRRRSFCLYRFCLAGSSQQQHDISHRAVCSSTILPSRGRHQSRMISILGTSKRHRQRRCRRYIHASFCKHHTKSAMNMDIERILQENQYSAHERSCQPSSETFCGPKANSPGNSPLAMPKEDWLPPINLQTLDGLSVNHVFASIRLRHDLMLDEHLLLRPRNDPHCQAYWQRLDHAIEETRRSPVSYDNHQRYDFLKVVFTELADIIVSLLRTPSPTSPESMEQLRRLWPADITPEIIYATLDVDLIIQNLDHDEHDLWLRVHILLKLFDAICPKGENYRVHYMKFYFEQGLYAWGIHQCFKIVESVKLDCATKALHIYRPLLLKTCPKFEWQYFLQQLQHDRIDLMSVIQWLHVSHKKYGESSFHEMYYKALVHLVTDEGKRTGESPTAPSNIPFPVTLQHDEHRITHDFRLEYRQIVNMALWLLPYRMMAGRYATSMDICRLRDKFAHLFCHTLSRCVLDGVSLGAFYRQLSFYSCHLAVNAHDRYQSRSLDKKQIGVMENWCYSWLSKHDQSSSPIHQLVGKRVQKMLQAYCCQETIHNPMAGLEVDMNHLGNKIRTIGELNLHIYQNLYRCILQRNCSGL